MILPEHPEIDRPRPLTPEERRFFHRVVVGTILLAGVFIGALVALYSRGGGG